MCASVGLHSDRRIATWDIDKLAASFDFVMWSDLPLYPKSKLAAFLRNQKELVKDFSKRSDNQKCVVGWPDSSRLGSDPIGLFKTIDSCLCASIGGANGILGFAGLFSNYKVNLFLFWESLFPSTYIISAVDTFYKRGDPSWASPLLAVRGI